MNGSISSLVGVTAFALVAAAQSPPSFETFAGFTYTRANAGPSNFPSFSAYGGSGQFVVNFSGWLGFPIDVGAVHNRNVGGVGLETTLVNFLVGPRVSIRRPRVTPYVQVLFGGASIGATDSLTPGNGSPEERHSWQSAFAMTVGGGMDIKINNHVSFRMYQLEYFLSRFQNPRTLNDNNQNHLRYSTGLNFTFGAQ
jgi:opacity protein-like surface antigen